MSGIAKLLLFEPPVVPKLQFPRLGSETGVSNFPFPILGLETAVSNPGRFQFSVSTFRVGNGRFQFNLETETAGLVPGSQGEDHGGRGYARGEFRH